MYNYKHTSNEVASCLADEILNNLVIRYDPASYLGHYDTRYGLLPSYAIAVAGAWKDTYFSELVDVKMCYRGETHNIGTLTRMLASLIMVRKTGGVSGLVYPHRICDTFNEIIGTNWCEAIPRVNDETRSLLRDLYSNNGDGLAGGFKSVALNDLGNRYEDDYAWSGPEYKLASELQAHFRWYARNLAPGESVKRPESWGPDKNVALVKYTRTTDGHIAVTVKEVL